MDDIMKLVTSLEESALLIKEVTKTIINKTKEQKGKFHSMLLGILGATLSGAMSAGKGIIQAGEGMIGASEGTTRVGQNV